MAIRFRVFRFQAHLVAGAFATLLLGAMLSLAVADPIDETKQTCDNWKADPDDRIPACTRLLESTAKDADVVEIYVSRAKGWHQKGNFDNAIADYRAALNRNPKLSAALQGLGDSYFRKSEFHSAIKAYSEALAVEKKSEKKSELFNSRGLAQFNIGEFSSAIKDFVEAIKVNPKFSSAYNNRGIAYTMSKQFESAIKDFTKAIEIDPRFVDAYMSRSEILIYEKGDLDGGVRDIDRAISLDAKNGKAYSFRGEVMRQKGNLDQAIADHETAIRLNPTPESFGNRALAWKDKGDLDRAIADYDDAIFLNPNFALAYAGRGEILRLKGEFNRALADLDKAVSLNPKSAPSLYLRGKTLQETGALDRAIADYNEALRLIPGLAAVLTNRGLAYESKGDLAKARADFAEALKLPPLSDAETTKPAQETARSHLEALDKAAREAKEAREKATREEKEAREAMKASQPALADPGKRVALVIGMSAYASHSALPNAKRDAQAIAASLREVGFQTVAEGYDLNKRKLESTLQSFAQQATTANWAVIYYAGHGIEIGGTNYLIPIDAKLASDRDVSFEAVPLDQVVLAADGAKKLHLVLLDACRDNPFAKTMQRTDSLVSRSLVSRGLASIEPEAGTMVVYAARAGEVALDGSGDHSPFAQALVNNFKKRGVEIRKLFDLVRDDVMKATDRHQLPFHYGTLPGEEDFYFRWK